ncbi:MAG: ABC transporter ATP-binding protein/permease [Acidimicrobiia bacterium]|nr:ABC transporter ATP-binding protein/permease [Acidimicrobiia bacterium]MCY4457323.1 ABC transporter ATP-binding protein [Acidimicrobiaceae bacterium]
MTGPSPFQVMHSLTADRSELSDIELHEQTRQRVLAFARPYRSAIAVYLSIIVLSTFLGLLPPLLIRQIFDVAIEDRNRGFLNILFAVMVVAASAEALLSLVERWLGSRIGEGLIFDLRVCLFDHVQRMPVAFFTRTQTGTLISRLNNDVIGAQRAFTGTLGTVVGNVITLTGTLVAMLILEWRLTLLAIVILPVFLLPARRVGTNLQAITRESMNLNASMNNTMTERFNVAGALLVKLFGRHSVEANEFSARAGRVRDIGVRSAMYSRVFFVALSFVGALGTAVVYWLGGYLVINTSITIGTLTALGLYTVRIYLPLTSLSNARVDVLTAFVSFERVFEVLDAPNAIVDAADAAELENPRGDLRFDNVTFRYPDPPTGTPPSLGGDETTASPTAVLQDINLTVRAGQMIAIVGPSGSGKTTLTSLVPRLYDVTSGAISVDGHDVRTLTQDSLRRSIGVVSQDPHLFHDTVEMNLRYARATANRKEIEAACRAARIHEVVAALPDGYDTIVGERGYRLSGGEKQRLAIARMLLKNPAIVVLDEATSHLDTENEAYVQEALINALAGRTSLVIAHRLSTITDADLIVVLDNGRIVETGTHDELRKRGGLYEELYEVLVRADHT